MLQDDDEEEDEDDYEQEHEHQWEKQEMADLAIHPLPLTELSFSLAFALWNYFVQLEDRQRHRDHDPTYNYPKKHDQERCDERGESVEHCFDFFVPRIRHFLEHRVDLASRFARRNHAQHHRWKDRFFRYATERLSPFSTIRLKSGAVELSCA